MATKQARGTKRTCQNCDERFYDLDSGPHHLPVLRHQICNRVVARRTGGASGRTARTRAKKGKETGGRRGGRRRIAGRRRRRSARRMSRPMIQPAAKTTRPSSRKRRKRVAMSPTSSAARPARATKSPDSATNVLAVSVRTTYQAELRRDPAPADLRMLGP